MAPRFEHQQNRQLVQPILSELFSWSNEAMRPGIVFYLFIIPWTKKFCHIWHSENFHWCKVVAECLATWWDVLFLSCRGDGTLRTTSSVGHSSLRPTGQRIFYFEAQNVMFWATNCPFKVCNIAHSNIPFRFSILILRWKISLILEI